MGIEKRKTPRKTLVDYHVWIERADGSGLLECRLGNMSETGAKLVFGGTPDLPQEFILRLSRDGRVARKCRVAWKTDNEMGVQFTAKLMRTDADMHPARA